MGTPKLKKRRLKGYLVQRYGKKEGKHLFKQFKKTWKKRT